MRLYEKNLQKLKLCLIHDDIYDELNNVDGLDGTVIEKDGIWYGNQQNEYIQLESRNREREAELLFEDIVSEKENLIFILGIGNRALLDKISEFGNTMSKFVIYEPDIKVLKYVMETIDLKDVLIPGKTLLWWNYKKEDFKMDYGSDLLALNWGKLVYNIKVIMCPGYAFYSKEFRKIFESAKKEIYRQFMALGNSLEDVLQGFQQNAKNFIACTKTNHIQELYDQFSGMPAIIVAAGPSLEKNIHLLKEANNKALILACDASYNACKQYDVTPDAVVSIERGIETYEYYYKDKEFDEDVVLIGPSLLWPEIYKKYPGKKILVSKNDDGVDGWWNRQFENLKYINTGMSCANLACAAAVIAGCSPIILIGQDLAFTGNKKHSKFTHVEQEGENNAESSDGLLVEDIFGNMIPTDKYYNLFRYWFEDLAKYNEYVELIDATEGGAKINGSTIMTLREAIDTYCHMEKGKKMSDVLSDKIVSKSDIIKKKDEVIKETNRLIRKLYKIKSKTEKHYDTLDKLYDKINDELEASELIKIVKQMQGGDQIINYMISQRDTITFFQQYIAQTIAHVKALGNELTPVNVLKNLYIQGNLMGSVKRACRMLITECENLKETVQKECDEYMQEE